MNKNFFILICASVFLVSCSTLEGLRFWQSDEVDPDEPKELTAFSDQKNISIDWSLSFDGDNQIGSFEPGFSSENLFFADAEGNVVSLMQIMAKKIGVDNLIF